jgi:hypothetical protein
MPFYWQMSFCCQSSYMICFRKFLVISLEALITYLTASESQNVETTLYIPACVFFGTPRENSTMPQQL